MKLDAGIGEPIRQAATGSENNQVLEDARTTEYLDPRIRDAMAPDGLDDNMYTDDDDI